MHPETYQAFEHVLADRVESGANVLEVGARPDDTALLASDQLDDASRKVGINLEGGGSFEDFRVIEGSGRDMHIFDDDAFDIVLSNATLEHDRAFWETVDEIHRVARPDATIAIGVPGYTQTNESRSLVERTVEPIADRVRGLYDGANSGENGGQTAVRPDGGEQQRPSYRVLRALYDRLDELTPAATTPTYPVHGVPDDYYRFSTAAVSEVFLGGCRDVRVREVGTPPRLLGVGTVETEAGA